MPYIKKEQRHEHDALIERISINLKTKPITQTVGELNYIISRILAMSLNLTSPKYNTINSAIGVLECVKLELYSRIANKYEQIKINENGDIKEYMEFDNASM